MGRKQSADRLSLAILGTRGVPARYGGFETFAEELGARLADSGVEVTVYCERQGEAGPERWRGMQLVHLPAPRLGPATTLWFDLLCLLHAARRHRVVYMLGYGSALLCVVARLAGAELWINMDGLEWRRSKWSWPARLWLRAMEAVAVRVAHRVVADAAAIGDYLSTRYRLPALHVVTYGAPVRDAAPTEPLAHWELNPGGYFLVVCRLEPENHVREIIDGYLASESALPLVVVGDHQAPGGYTAELRRRSAADDRLRFIGTVYQPEVLTALRLHSRAYFHGHSVGGTNPSLLEALGCGNRVLAHDNPFNREVAGECARYFRAPEQIPELVQWINGLTPRAHGALAAAARRRIAQHYNWEQVSDTYRRMLPDAAALTCPEVETS